MFVRARQPHGASGFSLVEMQIATAIAVTTIVAAISLYIFYWRTFTVGNTILDVYSNSRIAVGYMARDIRSAAQIVTSTPDNAYVTSDSCIVLKVPAIDASDEPVTSAYDYIIYQLQGDELYRVVQADALSDRQDESRAIAEYCTSLSFRSGDHPLSYYVSGGQLSTLNTVGLSLPLNKDMISLTGQGEVSGTMTPTMVIRLRNK